MFIGPACKLKVGPDQGSFRNRQWCEKGIVSEKVLCLLDTSRNLPGCLYSPVCGLKKFFWGERLGGLVS